MKMKIDPQDLNCLYLFPKEMTTIALHFKEDGIHAAQCTRDRKMGINLFVRKERYQIVDPPEVLKLKAKSLPDLGKLFRIDREIEITDEPTSGHTGFVKFIGKAEKKAVYLSSETPPVPETTFTFFKEYGFFPVEKMEDYPPLFQVWASELRTVIPKKCSQITFRISPASIEMICISKDDKAPTEKLIPHRVWIGSKTTYEFSYPVNHAKFILRKFGGAINLSIIPENGLLCISGNYDRYSYGYYCCPQPPSSGQSSSLQSSEKPTDPYGKLLVLVASLWENSNKITNKKNVGRILDRDFLKLLESDFANINRVLGIKTIDDQTEIWLRFGDEIDNNGSPIHIDEKDWIEFLNRVLPLADPNANEQIKNASIMLQSVCDILKARIPKQPST
jgi:hypothetical protein